MLLLGVGIGGNKHGPDVDVSKFNAAKAATVSIRVLSIVLNATAAEQRGSTESLENHEK